MRRRRWDAPDRSWPYMYGAESSQWPQFIDDEADHLRPVGARASDLRNVGRIDDQRRLVVIGRQHRIVKGAEETRLRLHLSNGFGRKFPVEIYVLKQHVATAYAGVGIFPTAGKDASVGRVAALGEIIPVERIGIVVGVGRRALLHGDGHTAEHTAVAQRKITARQSALRVFGTVPESLVAVSARSVRSPSNTRRPLRTTAGSARGI